MGEEAAEAGERDSGADSGGGDREVEGLGEAAGNGNGGGGIGGNV